MDPATAVFTYHLSTRNPDWMRLPTGKVSIPAARVRIHRSGRGFDAARAAQIAESWGFDFLSETRSSHRTYWQVKRHDAPPIDIIGGPSRNIVRQNPSAQQEAERVRQEYGIDVMNPEACYAMEHAAGEAAAGGFSGWFAATTLWAIGLGTGYFAGMAYDTLPVSLPLGILGITATAAGFRPAISGHRRKKTFKQHRPHVDAIRRVVRVAEEELCAGWRPDALQK